MHFQTFQTDFAARLRDPRAYPRPDGVPVRRMRVYEELVFNNIDGFVSACFPISKQCLGGRAWTRAVKAFFAASRLHSPLFRDIPEAFLDWMAEVAPARFPNKPWLAEFMHYEWLELVVQVHPDLADSETIDPDGDPMAAPVALNPATRLGCYRYAVERIGPRKRPKADGATHCYLVYRAADDTSRFIKVNPLSARLYQIFDTTRLSGAEAVDKLAAEIGHSYLVSLRTDARALLVNLRAEGVILGTYRE